MKKRFWFPAIPFLLAMVALFSLVGTETASAHTTRMQTTPLTNSQVVLQSTTSESAQAALMPSATSHGCSYKYLCLYSDINFQGQMLSLYNCEFVNLGQRSFPGGGVWNDKVSSWVNNQIPNTQSSFYNWDGVSSWQYLDSSHAYSENSSVGWYNDMMDGVQVC